MLKPLELTIYQRGDDGDYQDPECEWWIRAEDVDTFVEQKRLTNAELAAEYWLSMSGLFYGHGKAARKKSDTLHRFATLPHALDEDVTP